MNCRSCAIIACAVFLALQVCAHYPVNEPKEGGQRTTAYRFNEQAEGNNTDSLFVCLVFSDAGTRAATLSDGVLKNWSIQFG